MTSLDTLAVELLWEIIYYLNPSDLWKLTVLCKNFAIPEEVYYAYLIAHHKYAGLSMIACRTSEKKQNSIDFIWYVVSLSKYAFLSKMSEIAILHEYLGVFPNWTYKHNIHNIAKVIWIRRLSSECHFCKESFLYWQNIISLDCGHDVHRECFYNHKHLFLESWVNCRKCGVITIQLIYSLFTNIGWSPRGMRYMGKDI
jgi:hypothetical protein